MARPLKTGIDYFPLDVDFFVDEKLIAIAGEFGIKGEAAVIHLLCAIYRNGYYAEWNEMLRSKLHRELPCVSIGLLDMIVARLVKWEFFDKELFYSSSVLTSKGIQRRYFTIARKRKSDHQSLPYLLSGNSKPSSVSSYSHTSDTPQPMPNVQPIQQSMSQPVPVPAVISGNKDNAMCLNHFFSDANVANIDQLMMNLSLRPEDKNRLRKMAEEVVNEWNVTSTIHRDYPDWARHLINTIRIKLQEEKRGNNKNNKVQVTTAPATGSYQFDGGFGGQDI